MPSLRLEATTSAKEGGGKEILVNGVVKVDVVLYRDHASEKPSEKTPAVAESKMNPQVRAGVTGGVPWGVMGAVMGAVMGG